MNDAKNHYRHPAVMDKLGPFTTRRTHNRTEKKQ